MDDKFYFPSSKISPSLDSIRHEEVFIAIDTVRLNAVFIKPSTKPKATIFFLHGAGGNISTYLYMVRPLVNDGYQVFMIDFRGYGKSTGKPTHLNIASDGQRVLNYLLQRSEVKNTKIIVYGASIGTQEAVHLTKDNPDKISALILDGTISSFTDIAVDQAPAAQRIIIKIFVPSPYSAKEDIKTISSIPKLFIHSPLDTQVPLKEGELVYNNALKPKVFFKYSGEHLQAMKLEPTLVLQKINELLTDSTVE
ncbi:alpha/beta hydrolase [Hymenobacter sp. UV11]|uniref:alpha/beta hydrolase n=1 Tax=Hymenobacter sp. UV11 TaxID=1849735 RepID=UPI00196B2A23|nr:alpha/beta fold hydrolase [Hymenobacter sp. UV11]